MRTIVAIGGLAGVGKDTVADYLVDHYGFQKVSLADPIKEILNKRFGWTDEDWQNRSWKELAVPCHGEDQRYGIHDKPFSPRSWAQWLGTEVGRKIAGPDVWVDRLIDQILDAPVGSRFVVADVRFENEVHNLADQGATTIFIKDPERAINPFQHVSEQVQEDWFDYTVYANRGLIGETFLNVDLVMHLEGINHLKVKVS